jgi:hypothetical protein
LDRETASLIDKRKRSLLSRHWFLTKGDIPFLGNKLVHFETAGHNFVSCFLDPLFLITQRFIMRFRQPYRRCCMQLLIGCSD